MSRHECISKALCWVKNHLIRLHIVWFHLYDILEKADYRDGEQISGHMGYKWWEHWKKQQHKEFGGGNDRTVLILIAMLVT